MFLFGGTQSYKNMNSENCVYVPTTLFCYFIPIPIWNIFEDRVELMQSWPQQILRLKGGAI